jgi:hypothetical protein
MNVHSYLLFEFSGGRTGLKTGHERHDCHRGDDACQGAEELLLLVGVSGRLLIISRPDTRTPTP